MEELDTEREEIQRGRSSTARIIDWIVIVIVTALLVVAYLHYGDSGDSVRTLAGQEAPQFNLRTNEGGARGLSDHPGRVVLLDFWATWCNPCKRQIPELVELENDPKYRGRVSVLSINTDDPSGDRPERVESFLERNGWDFEVLYDNGSVSNLYGVRRIPTLVLIQPDGFIYYADSGVHDADQLRRLVDEAEHAGGG